MDVKMHTNAFEQFEHWRISLAVTERECSTLARQYWKEFQAEIVRANGPPKNSIRMTDPQLTGQDYWLCSFPPHYLATVLFREKSHFLKLWTQREAIVTEFNFSPGLADRVRRDIQWDQT